MSFYMPTVDFDAVPYEHQKAMSELVSRNRLVEMPKHDRSDAVKLIHHFLLKFLYPDKRWSTPLHHAWYMPHLVKTPSEDMLRDAEIAADEIYRSNCFGSPQPVYMGDKQYLVTREDGSTFVMKVS